MLARPPDLRANLASVSASNWEPAFADSMLTGALAACIPTGEAASDAEVSLVTKLASDVRGVNSVTNKMVVNN